MKSTSTELATHLAGPVTTLATCWRISRIDGKAFFFTDHDRDLSFEGNVYKASSGYSRTAIFLGLSGMAYSLIRSAPTRSRST